MYIRLTSARAALNLRGAVGVNVKRKDLWVIIVNFIVGTVVILATAFCLNKSEWYLQAAAYFCAAAFMMGDVVAFALDKQSIVKSLFLFNVVALIIIGSLAVLNLCGIFDSLSDLEKVKELILNSGSGGYAIYAAITIVNVVILPIPALVMMLAGVAVFGALKAFIITYISVMAGSIIAFFIGRIFGKRVVNWCVGEEATAKYSKMVGKKGNALFVIMQLLPFFPDDILCMVAGLTSMSFAFFTISMAIVKPIYIATVCFLGTGSIIPFSGWGIPVWIAIFAVIAVLFILFCKYQSRIEAWLNRFRKRDKKESADGESDVEDVSPENSDEIHDE